MELQITIHPDLLGVGGRPNIRARMRLVIESMGEVLDIIDQEYSGGTGKQLGNMLTLTHYTVGEDTTFVVAAKYAKPLSRYIHRYLPECKLITKA